MSDQPSAGSATASSLQPPRTRVDVLVAGAGYVGLSVAVAIRQAAPMLRVEVVDAAPEGAWERDARASAVAAAAVAMLRRLGAWDALRNEAEPIRRMRVTDSRTGDAARPVLLTFGADGPPAANEPFAFMVPNPALNGALRDRAEALGIAVRQNAAVCAIIEQPASIRVSLGDGSAIEAGLLVAADGLKSRIRAMAGIRTVTVDYGQSGIVATVRHERPHEGTAEEHFLPAGPFAILPLKNNRASLVWTESTRDAERLVSSDPFLFEIELERRFGRRLGRVEVEGTPRAFPLGLTLARDFVRPRIALAGDAAHGIHPIAGQGLNLGFKDAAALAEVVVDAVRHGRDPGALDVLETYSLWRRFDTVRMGVTTDVLNRLFSNDSGPLRAARSLGLSLVDRAPRLKRWFIAEAAGRNGPTPRLLRGEPI